MADTFGLGGSTHGGWPPPRYVRRQDDPTLEGDGPAECSSSTALSVLPGIIFDVNGYYRDLGVKPTATRKEMRLAFVERDGPNSARLMYVFKQLLDPETRFAYDCTPLGELFLDKYVQEALDRKIKMQVSERMQRLHDMGFEDVDQDALQRDVAAEMGFDYADDTPLETVDSDDETGQDEPVPAKFDYAYYVWAMSPSTAGTPTAEARRVRLAEWQRQLVRALSAEGIQMRFSVGLHRKPNRWVQGLIGYRTVFFLNDFEEPSEELATQVAQRIAGTSKAGRPARSSNPLALTER